MSRRKGTSLGEIFFLLAVALALGWALKQLFNLLRWLLRLIAQLWGASKPERDKIWAVAADEVDRLMGRLMDDRLVDLSLCFFGGVLLLLVLVDSSWVIKTLDNFGDTNVPFVGWAVLGFAGGAAMSAISRFLEIDWLRIRLPVAQVPDIGHLHEGEAEAHRSLRVRQVIGVIGITVLAALFGVGYWQNSQFPYGAGPDVKAQAIAAAAKSANMAVLNDAVAYAEERIEVNPKVALSTLVVLINASKTSKDAEVLKIAADANKYLDKYRLDTEMVVSAGGANAVKRIEAFSEVDKVTSLNWLGRLYASGQSGGGANLIKAFESYQSAAALGDTSTAARQEDLAHVMAVHADQTVRQAVFSYLERKAKGESPSDWYWFGEWYRSSARSGDQRRAEIWLGKAASQQVALSIRDIAFKSLLKLSRPNLEGAKLIDDVAYNYVNGEVSGVSVEMKKLAFDYIETRANNGEPVAMAWTAVRYRNGDGVAKDAEKENEWLLQAATQTKNTEIRQWAEKALGVKNTEPNSLTATQNGSPKDPGDTLKTPEQSVRTNPITLLTQLSEADRRSIEFACNSPRLLEGPAAYNACLSQKLKAMEGAPARPNLSQLSEAEMGSIESACNSPRLLQGPAAYNTCLSRKLKAMEGAPARPNLSQLSEAERRSIESACNSPRLLEGPAAYNACLSQKLKAMEGAPARPNLSQLSEAERRSIESACNSPRLLEGPAAYNTCLSRKLSLLIR